MFVRILVLLFAIMLVVTGCGALEPVNVFQGSGRPVPRTFAFAGFDSLEIGSAFRAEITAADDYLVEVTVDDNLVEDLQVAQQGKTVKIGLKPNTIANNAEMRVRITLPVLVSLDAGGATRAELSGFQSDQRTRLKAAGASKVHGDMETGDLTVDVSGGSTLTLSGSGQNLRATASGASTADLRDFAVNDANVEASGASRMEINVAENLVAKASGASTIHYAGNPTLDRIDESGASTVSGQ
jgi:hypothetical protein